MVLMIQMGEPVIVEGETLRPLAARQHEGGIQILVTRIFVHPDGQYVEVRRWMPLEKVR